MLFIFTLILLLCVLCYFSFPVLETFLSFIVLTQCFFYLLGASNIPYSFSVFISVILGGASCYFIQKKFREEIKGDKKDKKEKKINKLEVEVGLFFIITYIVLYAISLSHADFIALGERLRDYGILSSVVYSPIHLNESWFSGFELNYYGFWYRLGSIIHLALGYRTWDVYHILVSLNTTFYVSFIFLIFRKYLKLNLLLSLLCTFIAFPGSNFSGIKFFFTDDMNWWGPSRVIKGAITEFPMWSFILGDAHPHFLNLLLFPFLISFILFLDPLSFGKKEKIFFLILILFIPLNILANANPWDLPVYLMLFIVMVSYIIGVKFVYKKSISVQAPKSFSKEFFGFCIFLFVVVCFSLFLSSRNISPTTTELRVVSGSVLRTQINEFFDAFLFPACFIFIGNLFLLEKKYRTSFFFLVILSLFLQQFLFDAKENQNLCVMPLAVIFIYNMDRLIREAKDFDIEDSTKRKSIIFESIGVSALLIWIVPEFIYLNDSYGVGLERMNTIFKLYSVGWALAYIFSFYILNKVKEKYKLQASVYWFVVPLMIISVLCFFKLINIRFIQNEISLDDRRQGLTEVSRMYNGAKETISAFRELPRGTVMESTKGAYNYASFVATLSDKDSYLGWMNHVGLLYKKDNENMERVRRENDIRNFYTTFSCEQRKQYLRDNGISYVVLGPLEREEFGERLNNDFYCLKNIIQYGDFTIFSSED